MVNGGKSKAKGKASGMSDEQRLVELLEIETEITSEQFMKLRLL